MSERSDLIELVRSIVKVTEACIEDIGQTDYTKAALGAERMRQLSSELSSQLIKAHGRDEQDSYVTGQP